MKVFEDLAKGSEVGQSAQDFRVDSDLALSDLKGSPILLVFWKIL